MSVLLSLFVAAAIQLLLCYSQ